MDVDRMLREMSTRQFLEWMAFDEIEPFLDRRLDLNAASIACLLANINRDPKKTGAFKISDFVLKYSTSEGKRQTWQDQKALMKFIAAAYAEPSVKPKVKRKKKT